MYSGPKAYDPTNGTIVTQVYFIYIKARNSSIYSGQSDVLSE